MRKLSLFALLGALLVTAPAFATDAPSFDYAIKKMSEGQKVGSPTRVIKLVRYASADANATSLVSGDAAVYSLVSDDGVTVTRTIQSGDGAFAGIVVTTIQSSDSTTGTSASDDLGHRNWGWILIHGPGTATITAGGTNNHSAGDVFITSIDEGRITTLPVIAFSNDPGVVATAGYNSRNNRVLKAVASVGGFFMDAVGASDTTADVFVKAE